MTAKNKPIAIQNVYVDPPSSHGYMRTHAGFTFKTARYHVWFDISESGKPVKIEDVLYKNSIAKHGEPGYWRTRTLDATKPVNAGMLTEMWRQIKEGGLIAKALAETDAKAAANREEIEGARMLWRVKEAGPTLLDACREALAFLDAPEPWPDIGRDNLRRKIVMALTEAGDAP